MTLCRLCCLTIHIPVNYISLFDENDKYTEVYDIASRYFESELLNPIDDNSKDARTMCVLCGDCWRHINDFYTFQQSIFSAQTQLSFTCTNKEFTSIKLEEDEVPLLELVDHNNAQIDNLSHKYHDNLKIDMETKVALDQLSLTSFYSSCSSKDIKLNYKDEKYELFAKNNIKGILVKNEDEETLNSITEESEDNGDEYNDKTNTNELKKSQKYDAFIAEWKHYLDCFMCTKVFANLTLLRAHFRVEHQKQKCYVLCCQRKLYYRRQIVEHIRVHIDPNTFRCEVCGKCASNSRALKKHMNEKHTEEGQTRRFECHICYKRFAKKGILKGHLETHMTGAKDHVCKHCGKGFILASRLKIHERTVHNVDHVCDKCGKTIHGKYALEKHLQEHDGIMKRKWSCDRCDVQLNSHSSLKRHKEAVHHDGSKTYECLECGRILSTEHALLSHRKYAHQSIRKYKCNLCDKAFKVAIVLREHIATHTGEHLYQCPHCPKTFKVSSNMHHHRKKVHPIEWTQARQKKLSSIIPLTHDTAQTIQSNM